MSLAAPAKLLRGHLLHTPQGKLEAIPDGALRVDAKGVIEAKGTFQDLLRQSPSIEVLDYSHAFLLPSFFDTHIHFPQLDMIGSCADELLMWLDSYTFPTEQAFRGKTPFVAAAADNFIRELKANGTGCAVIYSSSCGDATDLLFEAMEASGLRAIIGKTSMDRHCPPEIAVDLQKDIRWTEDLIKRWHGKDDRLYYALTPRFAPSCSDPLLSAISALYQNDPSLYLQTHYAENQKELAWVAQLYPDAKNYLDVYASRGLLKEKTILAHAIHVSPEEEALLLAEGVSISHCPSSNLFLGSGLCRCRDFIDRGMKLHLGTDIGAGTSFSQWQTMNEAYKVAQLRQARITPTELFAMATIHAAQALGFEQQGRLDKGCSADIQILNPSRRPILARHLEKARSPEETLAALIHFADDRTLEKLYVQGRLVHSQ